MSTTATRTSFTGGAAPPLRRRGLLGERRVSKDRGGEKKLMQGFGNGIKEIQLDQECKEKKSQSVTGNRTSFILVPSEVKHIVRY